jgi:tellurite resistance protein
MRITSARSTVTVDYQPASAGLDPTGWDTKLPDVFELEVPSKVLATIFDEATDELDAYSRWLGRNPEAKQTLPALALLPAILIDTREEPLNSLLRMVNGRLSTNDQALIDGPELVRAWVGAQSAKLTKQESTALAQLLARQGIGLEPDPRFGGGPLGPGPAVLFRIDPENAPHSASSAYTAAATVIRLAAAVASADTSSTAEQDYLLAHLESALDLSAAERQRLRAHLHLLLSAPVKLTGLMTRVADLDGEDREQIARLCVAVAAADGVIAPAEMATLTKIYKLLELPDTRVHHDVHSASVTAAKPADEPITVRPASAHKGTGYVLPAPPTRSVKAGLGLDQAMISAKLAESAKVSALLGSIFVDDETPSEPVQPPADPDVPLVAGLDGPHSRLFRELVLERSWPRATVEDICTGLGLLTDGALEVLNDAAFECAGDPVVTGTDPLEIDFDVVREMQR